MAEDTTTEHQTTKEQDILARLTMLARESRSLIDLGVARNLDRAYVESWMRLADELEHVRDDLHNAQLTKDDIVNGAVPK